MNDDVNSKLQKFNSEKVRIDGIEKNFAKLVELSSTMNQKIEELEQKQNDLLKYEDEITEYVIRLREEISMQIKALKELKEMANSYGFDISKPAKNAKEATQWLYFGYLAAIKENNGAAMSLGRTSTFLDIYIH